jgi:hypothetical protein
MALHKNYIKSILKLGNQATVLAQIQDGTNTFQRYSKDLYTLKTIFDVSLNPPGVYCPNKNTSLNKGICYDQVDIFYLISSCIAGLQNMPINRTGVDFQQMYSYVLPGYNNMINRTKYIFHYSISNKLDNISLTQIVIATAESILCVIAVVIMSFNTYRYYNKK